MYQIIRRLFTLIIVLLLAVTSAPGQIGFSDSLRISLLTCTPGPDAYERFGHSGIRIEDLRSGMDVTFHYGVFSFNTPHFVYRFVKGETDYQLGAVMTEDFIGQYRRRGLGMTQATLRLTPEQQQDIVERLLVNYRPENRTYRYSYFFDNCATRPYHLIETATGGSIDHDSLWCHAITLRDMVHQKTGMGNWLQFGIALAVAQRADVPTSYEEQMFLPDYLERAYRMAKIDGEPMVTKWEPLLTMTDEVKERMEDFGPRCLQPDVVCGTLFAIALILTLGYGWRQRKEQKGKAKMQGGVQGLQRQGGAQESVQGLQRQGGALESVQGLQRQGGMLSGILGIPMEGRFDMPLAEKIFDTIWLLLTGITGCIVWFLNFFSMHPAVDGNANCWWLLPTNVFFALLIWLKLPQKVIRIYFFINFAALIVYFMVDWETEQYCHPAFIPLLGMILARDYALLTREHNK